VTRTIESAQRDDQGRIELVQVPAQPLLRPPPLVDEIITMINQQLDLAVHLLTWLRPRQVRLAQRRPRDCERVDRVRLPARPTGSAFRHRQLRRDSHKLFAQAKQLPLQPARRSHVAEGVSQERPEQQIRSDILDRPRDGNRRDAPQRPVQRLSMKAQADEHAPGRPQKIHRRQRHDDPSGDDRRHTGFQPRHQQPTQKRPPVAGNGQIHSPGGVIRRDTHVGDPIRIQRLPVDPAGGGQREDLKHKHGRNEPGQWRLILTGRLIHLVIRLADSRSMETLF